MFTGCTGCTGICAGCMTGCTKLYRLYNFLYGFIYCTIASVAHKQALHTWRQPHETKNCVLIQTVDGRNFASDARRLFTNTDRPQNTTPHYTHIPPSPRVQCCGKNVSGDLRHFFRWRRPRGATKTKSTLSLGGRGGGE